MINFVHQIRPKKDKYHYYKLMCVGVCMVGVLLELLYCAGIVVYGTYQWLQRRDACVNRSCVYKSMQELEREHSVLEGAYNEVRSAHKAAYDIAVIMQAMIESGVSAVERMDIEPHLFYATIQCSSFDQLEGVIKTISDKLAGYCVRVERVSHDSIVTARIVGQKSTP